MTDEIILVFYVEYCALYQRGRTVQPEVMLYEFLEELQINECERLEDRSKKIKAGKPVGSSSKAEVNVWAAESFPSLDGSDKVAERIRQDN